MFVLCGGLLMNVLKLSDHYFLIRHISTSTKGAGVSLRKLAFLLLKHNFNKIEVAKELNVHKFTIYYLLKKHNELAELEVLKDSELCDFAEQCLIEHVKDNNLNAAVFILKSLHPSYAEKSRVEIAAQGETWADMIKSLATEKNA